MSGEKPHSAAFAFDREPRLPSTINRPIQQSPVKSESSSCHRPREDTGLSNSRHHPVDPRRQWELQPFKDALAAFIQSDELFQRPQISFKPPTRGLAPERNVLIPRISKHSILSLLLHNKDIEHQIGDGKVGVGAHTQTTTFFNGPSVTSPTNCNSQANPKSIAGSILSSHRNEESTQESFPTYNDSSANEEHLSATESVASSSNSATTRKIAETASSIQHEADTVGAEEQYDGAEEQFDECVAGEGVVEATNTKADIDELLSVAPSQYYDESFPSYDSKCDMNLHFQSNAGSRDLSGNSEQLRANEQGCAWVVDFNSMDSGTRKDTGNIHHQRSSSTATAQHATEDTSLKSSASGDFSDYDDSTFLSEE